MAKERAATVIATGKKVTVYKHRNGEYYIDAYDCFTKYKESELVFD